MKDTLQQSILRIDQLHKLDSIKLIKLQNQFDSIKKIRLSYSPSIVDERLAQASDTINYLGAMATGWGTVYAALSIVAVIITFGIPYWVINRTYKALREMDGKIDRGIDTYFDKRAKWDIERAVSDIETQVEFLVGRGMTFLNLNSQNPIAETEISRIVVISNADYMTDKFHEKLSLILLYQESKQVYSYFKSILLGNYYDLIERVAFRYFSNLQYIEEGYTIIEKKLLNKPVSQLPLSTWLESDVFRLLECDCNNLAIMLLKSDIIYNKIVEYYIENEEGYNSFLKSLRDRMLNRISDDILRQTKYFKDI